MSSRSSRAASHSTGGTLDNEGSALYIDCSADGLAHREPTTVFSGDHISLQTVRTCQPAFSAAVIAHVEAAYRDDNTRNAFCGPVPYPREPTDWLRMMLAFNKNQLQWFSDPDMMAWVDAARLTSCTTCLPVSASGRARRSSRC